jgi:phosphatidylglycerophosphatase C
VERAVSVERVDARGVMERLARARVPGPSGVAFDADGTLWSGDVGEDVFETAYGQGLLRQEALEPLSRVCSAHGLSTRGSPSELAQRIHAAYRRHEVDELLTCEVMTWGYAGFTVNELRELARRVFAERRLAERVRRVLMPILAFARAEGFRIVVISASPHIIVAEGLRVAEIQVDALGAAGVAVAADVIEPRLDGRVPYGPEKCVAGARVLGSHDWLGSFGDNAFDVEMLRAARIGVAVHPKPALAARLGELSNTVVLE